MTDSLAFLSRGPRCDSDWKTSSTLRWNWSCRSRSCRICSPSRSRSTCSHHSSRHREPDRLGTRCSLVFFVVGPSQPQVGSRLDAFRSRCRFQDCRTRVALGEPKEASRWNGETAQEAVKPSPFPQNSTLFTFSHLSLAFEYTRTRFITTASLSQLHSTCLFSHTPCSLTVSFVRLRFFLFFQLGSSLLSLRSIWSLSLPRNQWMLSQLIVSARVDKGRDQSSLLIGSKCSAVGMIRTDVLQFVFRSLPFPHSISEHNSG